MTTDTDAPDGQGRETSIPRASVSSLPTSTDEARERWIDAACKGDLTSEQLGERLGVSSSEAQAIVDTRLRDVIRAVVDDSRDR